MIVRSFIHFYELPRSRSAGKSKAVVAPVVIAEEPEAEPEPESEEVSYG